MLNMDPKKITELANLLRQNGDKLLNSEFNFTLSGSLLRALNDSFTLIADTVVIGPSQNFQVVKAINSKSSVFRDLQLIHDFVQKTAFLCIIQYPGDVDYFNGKIDITKFRSLKKLEVQKTNVKQIVGIQPLRAQIQQLVCVKSLHAVEDIITHCGGDNANGFVWNELKIADFSYNQLQTVDTALEFAQYLQHLNLRHNQLISVEAIKWLPNLLTLDLSFNRLTGIPQFHLEACKRLQVLNMSNNYVEDLLGLSKLDVLTDLDLSDNCLLDHNYLAPLSTIYTLKYLNLYGNPLHCHPKHRLATAQFLHKNITTSKFTLDFESLSKNERALLGTQQMRRQTTTASYNRFGRSKSYAVSVGSSISRSLSSSTQLTPASSISSQSSLKLEENTSTTSTVPMNAFLESQTTRKRTSKIRNVEIPEYIDPTYSADKETTKSKDVSQNQITKNLETSMKSEDMNDVINREHLMTKQHIEKLRKKYGSEWLQSENAQMMHNVSGCETKQTNGPVSKELLDKRQNFKDYLSEFCVPSTQFGTTNNSNFNLNLRSSTPTEGELKQMDYIKSTISNSNCPGDESFSTVYKSIDNTVASDTDSTLYKSANYNELSSEVVQFNNDNSNNVMLVDEPEDDDITKHLKNIYSTANDEEPMVSEPEDDEETYIVYRSQPNESMFLTISSNFLKEKDTLTQKTKNKWSLKILESCDRIKSNTLRINFDTVKLDKQERIYIIEDGLCQELEKKLRNILSQRELSEMNQTIYRCVNCTCQFSQEIKNKYRNNNVAISCPDCKSNFVAEIHDIPRSLEKSKVGIKISPAAAALPIEEKADLSSNMTASQINKDYSAAGVEENNSIGSANSLNESSCSKISNSQNSASSGGSNQSVAGSTTMERDATNFKSNYESDVDIISNPSLSSIEVLEHMHQSRKTSEERRVLYAPNLETIEDHSYQQPHIEYTTFNNISGGNKYKNALVETDSAHMPTPSKQQTNKLGALAHHLNLTESSSSGSVTDSICTAYDQLAADKTLSTEPSEEQKQKIVIENLLQSESTNLVGGENLMTARNVTNKDDSSISSMFGALFQSTNILMSSSKKLLESEAGAKIQTGFVLPSVNNYQNSSNNSNESNGNNGSSKRSPLKYLINTCTPFKFNYTDFNDVDHRLKLYFYQTKFEEGEHFKWVVRGRIYNTSTHALCSGIVVMSTCKCYVMEMFAAENDDVSKWLRLHISFTVDRLEAIQLLPWKIGLSFRLRDWGSFLLLLQDILRTDSLLLYFANHSLPSQCELNYQISEQIAKRLNNAVVDEKLKMLSLLNGCEIKCENAKRAFALCGLLTTDTRLYLTSGNLSWLCCSQDNIDIDIANDIELELCITQFMSNLVEVERPAANVFIINFLDETQDKCEQWKCTFETKENAESCFNSIGESWEILFGVPLFTTAKET